MSFEDRQLARMQAKLKKAAEEEKPSPNCTKSREPKTEQTKADEKAAFENRQLERMQAKLKKSEEDKLSPASARVHHAVPMSSVDELREQLEEAETQIESLRTNLASAGGIVAIQAEHRKNAEAAAVAHAQIESSLRSHLRQLQQELEMVKEASLAMVKEASGESRSLGERLESSERKVADVNVELNSSKSLNLELQRALRQQGHELTLATACAERRQIAMDEMVLQEQSMQAQLDERSAQLQVVTASQTQAETACKQLTTQIELLQLQQETHTQMGLTDATDAQIVICDLERRVSTLKQQLVESQLGQLTPSEKDRNASVSPIVATAHDVRERRKERSISRQRMRESEMSRVMHEIGNTSPAGSPSASCVLELNQDVVGACSKGANGAEQPDEEAQLQSAYTMLVELFQQLLSELEERFDRLHGCNTLYDAILEQ